MKTWIFLLIVSLLVLQMPACIPDEDVSSDPVEKFLGTWKVTESCHRMSYDVEIVKDPGEFGQVLIYNFGNPGPGYDPVVGLVALDNIYVESQTIGEGWTVSGEGIYYNTLTGKISWTYTLVIPPNVYDCTATYTW